MRRFAAYGAAGLTLAVGIVVIAATALEPAGTRAVALSAAIAYVAQLAAFGGLVAVQSRPQLFLVVWLAGMAVRFALLGVLAFWVARTGLLPAGPLLLGYVGVVFGLVLLEPLFLRRKRPG
jgi:hypothetical protein